MLPIDWAAHARRIRGLYVHVPFCASDCAYCAFSREVPTSPQATGEYLDALDREVDWWLQRFADRLAPVTIYIGGGTPSYLSRPEIERLGRSVRRLTEPRRVRELTVEMNPESASAERLDAYLRLGMTRVSLGAQASHVRFLDLLDRRHEWSTVEAAVARVRRVPALALSLDLIYGIPGLTLEEWTETLQRTLVLGPDHLSAYCLTYEEGTSLARRRSTGRLVAQTDDLQRNAYDRLVEMAEAAGLVRYEVSNFGTARGRSLHNQGYWRGWSYLGVGPSAHSFVADRRFRNRTRRQAWQAALAAGEGPIGGQEVIGDAEAAAETLMRLRSREGVSRRRLPLSDNPFLGRVTDFVEEGLLVLTPTRLRLAPGAFFVSDGIIGDLLAAWERARRRVENLV